MSPLLVLEKGKRATGVVPRLSPSRDLHPYSIQAFLNAIHLDDLSASRTLAPLRFSNPAPRAADPALSRSVYLRDGQMSGKRPNRSCGAGWIDGETVCLAITSVAGANVANRRKRWGRHF